MYLHQMQKDQKEVELDEAMIKQPEELAELTTPKGYFPRCTRAKIHKTDRGWIVCLHRNWANNMQTAVSGGTANRESVEGRSDEERQREDKSGAEGREGDDTKLPLDKVPHRGRVSGWV